MSILHLLSTDGFISVNKILIKNIGLEHAVIIGELSSEYEYYKSRNQLTEDGYFFSTMKNIEEKTSIKEKRQRAVINELESLNLIKTVKRGLPSKRYIKLNEKELLDMISSPNKFGQNGGTIADEIAELDTSFEATNNNIFNNKKNNKNINNKDITQSEFEMLLELYNSIEILPKYRALSDKRKSHIKARLKEYGWQDCKEVLIKASISKFLTDKNNGWFTIDWIFNPTNFLKILEGAYDNKGVRNNGWNERPNGKPSVKETFGVELEF